MGKNLSKMQSDFIYYFSQTGNATQSAIKAGYKKTNADKMGYELKTRYQQQIDDEIKKQLSGSVPMALNRVVTLAQSAKQESIQLQASKDLLDRAGYQAVNLHQDVTNERSDKELQEELNTILNGIKGKPN
tara:strand:- start:2209 stop:2601 length:393 start_codon:yes stop_codon:yes gene_type:complete